MLFIRICRYDVDHSKRSLGVNIHKHAVFGRADKLGVMYCNQINWSALE